jgi:hypothetical protein
VWSKGVLNVLEHTCPELVLILCIYATIHEANYFELYSGDLSAFDQSFVRKFQTHPTYEGRTSSAFEHKAKRAKGREKLRMWDSLDDIGVGDQSSRQPDAGAVQRSDENLRMRKERA